MSVSNSEEVRIDFSVYNGRTQTKTGGGTSLNADFNVESYVVGAPSSLFFESTTYTYSASGYTGNPERFWPLEGLHLDFYAVNPIQYRNTSSSTVNLKPADSTFTLTATDGTSDILAAKKTNASKTTDNPVSLVFGHKLTRICFKVLGADTTKTYKIDSITVTANSTAKYNYGATENWSDSGTPYAYNFLNAVKTIPVKTMTAQPVGDTLYLIPAQEAAVRARVNYSIYEGNRAIDTTITPIEVYLPTTSLWGINKSVVYVLTLNYTSLVNPIAFKGMLDEWGDDKVIDLTHYIDENGNSWGPGINIGGVVWAPVNCGYEPANGDYKGYPYGKLYQWGRKYGQGYMKSPYEDADYPGKSGGTQTMVFLKYDSDRLTTHPDSTDSNAGCFYCGRANWYAGGGIGAPAIDELWKDNEKTSFDPCPSGWRVPTKAELKALLGTITVPSFTSGTHGCTEGIQGVKFDGGDGTSASNFVFLPASGYRNNDENDESSAINRGTYGNYWSSSIKNSYAWYLIYYDEIALMTSYYRAYGHSVRCVQE